MIKFMEKNYMAITMTVLLLAVYVIFFPFIAKGLELISPEITQCTYKKITGNNCPLCGGTRYMRGLGQVFTNPGYLWHPFGFMMFGVAFEFFFRLYCLYAIKKKKNLRNIIIFDIITTSIIIVAFYTYNILFVINGWGVIK